MPSIGRPACGGKTVKNLIRISILAALVALLLPLSAGAIVEPKTETEYPDEVTVEADGMSHSLVVTGVGLREKTMLKVDVYTIVSYVDGENLALEDDKGIALLEYDAVKQIRMDLRRSFSRDKLIKAFSSVIDKNYKDQAAFSADMETFFGYFDRDAEEGDVIIFTYVPGSGLRTTLNGEEKGTIENFEFVKALWTVWFGEKPANGGLKKAMLAALGD
jgi:hypothetical protein